MNKIIANFVNSILSGSLVVFGAMASGGLTKSSLLAAIGASFIVAITQFRDFWKNQEMPASMMLFKFI